MANVEKFERVKDKAKLVKLREEYRVSGNMADAARKAEVNINTARKWKVAGLLDLADLELQVEAVAAVGPETVQKIVTQAAENLLSAQDRVSQTVPFASARDASRIAVEQFNIMRVAQGQATEIHEFRTAEDVAGTVERLLNTQVIEAEAEVIDE